jgi:hypothetical protein
MSVELVLRLAFKGLFSLESWQVIETTKFFRKIYIFTFLIIEGYRTFTVPKLK